MCKVKNLTEVLLILHRICGASVSRNQASDIDDDSVERSIWESDKPLSERLKVGRGERFDPIPPQLLRKYIAYARKYVHPNLTKDAATVLQVSLALSAYFLFVYNNPFQPA